MEEVNWANVFFIGLLNQQLLFTQMNNQPMQDTTSTPQASPNLIILIHAKKTRRSKLQNSF